MTPPVGCQGPSTSETASTDEVPEARAGAAAKFFSSVSGTWVRKNEEQGSTSRVRTDDLISIDAACRGVLDRTVT